jgi:deoxyribodipyrimidine photo-lyase
MSMSNSIVWLRNDLRLSDNPALIAAERSGKGVLPVYIYDLETPGMRPAGAASRWWLHHSLNALDAAFRAVGSRLILRKGCAETVIRELVAECNADAIFWNRAYDQGSRDRETLLKKACREQGITVESFKANLLYEPWEVTTQSGQPFKVFTPFWRACSRRPPSRRPLASPQRLSPPDSWPASDRLDSWSLLPRTPDWAGGLREAWVPGEAHARLRLAEFIEQGLPHYHIGRELPAVESTSRLSPHLAFGEVSPLQIWHAVTTGKPSLDADKFLSELGWREFAHSILFYEEDIARLNVRREFDAFPWRDPDEDGRLEAWQRGRTGYPIVDAGLRELWATGWMHNRVRMIAASFLVKDLLIDWRIGEGWFWDTLVDADAANNPVGWQWVAGSGVDAAPYFRIFNPVLQGEKFDTKGDYVRRWIPEIAKLPNDKIHRPWLAKVAPDVYPAPIVDHAAARNHALALYRRLQGRRTSNG